MPTTDSYRSAISRAGALARWSPEQYAAAQQEVSALRLEMHIQQALEAKYPPTTEERQRLARMLLEG